LKINLYSIFLLLSFYQLEVKALLIDNIYINNEQIAIQIITNKNIHLEVNKTKLNSSKSIFLIDIKKEDLTNTISKKINVYSKNKQIGTISLEYYSSNLYEKLSIKNRGVINVFLSGNLKLKIPSKIQLETITDELKNIYSKISVLAQKNNSVKLCTSDNGNLLLKDLKNNICSVACSGKTIIVRDYLLEKGIFSRIVILEPLRYLNKNGILVQASEGHTALEIKYNNSFFLTDPTLEFMLILDDKNELLSASEFLYNIKRNKKNNIQNYNFEKYKKQLSRYWTKDKSIKYIGK